MKIRDSGMPDEVTWEHFFDSRQILARLAFTDPDCHVVEFGCGYGTFTVTAATLTKGTIYALDIEPAMLESTAAKAASLGLSNIRTAQRDFVQDGTGLPDGFVGYAMLFNILHAEEPLHLLREAHRVLRPGGRVGIIHWNYDAGTPRGPDLGIRPRPEDCQAWAQEAGFDLLIPFVSLPPYHYGIVGRRPA
ncbi:MAG: class I SAM-dependent methyltransferase [Verrucomicrobiae bacterium]|nr:class I SAM-dependent methyltransferase [Verrucomicrobiae bacterium]